MQGLGRVKLLFVQASEPMHDLGGARSHSMEGCGIPFVRRYAMEFSSQTKFNNERLELHK